MSSAEALTRRRSLRTECVRIACLVAAAIFAVLPFLTNRLIGGVDGRWYAYMLRGFTDQIGSGHFPHLLGEGPFAWNGGVHPFRSAPVYMLVGGLWRILSLGCAGTYTTEHLTVLTSALVGTLGFYRAALLVLGERRWLSAGFAVLYLFTPSWLATFYKADAYMSYMAFAAMPLVLFGNARTLHKPDGQGYGILVAGLALIWMCHPPIAFLSTTATLFIQAAALAEQGTASWKKIVVAGFLFAMLSAYYFCSMSELPPRPGGSSAASGVIVLVGIALFLVGIGRSVFERGRLAWLSCAVAGAFLVSRAGAPWLVWSAFTGSFALLAAVAVRTSKQDTPGRNAVVIVFFCALAGAAAAEAVLGKNYSAIDGTSLSSLAINTGQIWEFLRPLSREMNTAAVFQPGWTACLGLVLGVIGMLRPGPVGPKVFGAAALTLAICFMRVPLVSNFLVGYYPTTLAGIIGLPLPLRITPVLSSFSLMAGLLWVGARPPRRRIESVATACVMIAALVWSGFQTYRFVRIGYKLTSSKEGSELSLRPENVMLDRYAYDLLPIPDYYSNGIMDPQLESRLLRPDGTVLVGPNEEAAVMEKGGADVIRLTGSNVADSPTWMDVFPKLTIQPGAHVLLRYEFDPARNYTGYMMFFSEHSYREYHLPDSGQPNSFGIGGMRSSVLSFWNTGQTAEHYRVLINREPGNDLKGKGEYLASLTVSPLDGSRLPIQLLSLDPYHVVVKAPVAATLETFRILLPGYRAYVDGAGAPIARSKNSLLTVQVPAGTHDVVVKFVGTFRLWASAAVSAVSWGALVLVWMINRRRRSAAF